MAIVAQAVIAAVASVIGIYILTEDLVAGVLVGALISAGIFAVNMFMSRNDKKEIMDAISKGFEKTNARLDTMEGLLREIRDEMRQMRIEMGRLADALERLRP